MIVISLRKRRIVFLLMIASFMLGSCSRELSNIRREDTAARFDYFTYNGKDDFYEQNPLPSENHFYNPILPGWYSDPSICSNGEDYFLVTSTFSYYAGVPIFHSKDLVNWKQIGHILDRPSQLKLDGQKVSGGIFAPAISYNPRNQTYYMITTNVGGGNFFVKTKDPFGSWSDPVWLREVQGIDPSFFFDDDGKAYIVNNDAPQGTPRYDGHRAIRVQEFDVATEKTVGERKVLVDGGIHPEENPIWIEGPHIYKIKGQYFLMAAEGGTGPGHSEVILRGASPMGPFIPWKNNPILTQRHLSPDRANPITCAGHADLIQAKEGDWWAVFLACRPIDNKFENLGRETFMMPVRWSEDGFPYITQGEETIPMMLRRDGVIRQDTVTFGNFQIHDDFNAPSLSSGWAMLRSPGRELYSLEDKKGYLSMICANSSASERNTPAFISRRLQHHKFECSTRLMFTPQGDSTSAGLLLFKDEGHQYFLSITGADSGKRVVVEKVGEHNIEILASAKLNEAAPSIDLRIQGLGQHYTFQYATATGEWKTLLDKVDAYYLSTANSFGFTGTNIGMYARKNTGPVLKSLQAMK
jgi:xylan 1,4-beta-xylosidase